METENTPRLTGQPRSTTQTVDRLVLGFARHWLLFFNLFIFIYIGLPYLAPALMASGNTGAARLIYTIYSPLCHQLGYRSWFLYGEASNYPRAVFQQVTGINPDDLLGARAFLGDERVGYKVAFCQRDVAIYGGILLGGLFFGLGFVRQRLKPLHWIGWITLGVLPIGLDGFSQLFTQFPYNQFALFSWLPSRESTPEVRTLTGLLFGLANVWLAYPYVNVSMREAADELQRKLAQVQAR
jgi:uncharacterized membrane protein